MKKTVFALLLATNLIYGSDVSWNLSGSNGQIDGFTLSIGNYYRVPVNEVVVLERSIPREEMSVVYYLAEHSHKSPRYISDLRLRGMSWWDITLRLGLNPKTLYIVETHQHFGPPYGMAYGFGPKHHHLRDADIIDLVNVRFLSRYHHVSPDDIIRYRRGGDHYRSINERYRDKRHDIRDDRREIRDDRREIRNEKRNLEQDRRQLEREKKEVREERREVREERRDMREDRRDDRRDMREDRRDDRKDNRDERRDDRREDRGNGH